MAKRRKIGISACLLGEAVRYDGRDKRAPHLTDMLGRYFEYVPVCPEMECGLGVPREPMRLVGDTEAPRLEVISTGIDHTDRMLQWAHRRVRELETENLCGFVFKSKSPSCGLAGIEVYSHQDVLSGIGTGLFAQEFIQHCPLLPVVESDDLHDPQLRDDFIQRALERCSA